MPESPQSVDGYLASLPDGRREVVTRVHETIAEAVPEHRYASGREGDWFPIGLTNNKS
jgi:hypothetical protein